MKCGKYHCDIYAFLSLALFFAFLFLVLFVCVRGSICYAEELLPVGTVVKLPNGKIITLEKNGTLINEEEKTTLVRNDDLWASDKNELVEQKRLVATLKEDQALGNKSVELLKQSLELEQQKTKLEHDRAEFYKEQMAVKDKINEDALEKMEKLVEKSQPSALSKAASTGGWLSLLLTIGIIIGIAL